MKLRNWQEIENCEEKNEVDIVNRTESVSFSRGSNRARHSVFLQRKVFSLRKVSVKKIRWSPGEIFVFIDWVVREANGDTRSKNVVANEPGEHWRWFIAQVGHRVSRFPGCAHTLTAKRFFNNNFLRRRLKNRLSYPFCTAMFSRWASSCVTPLSISTVPPLSPRSL